MDIETYKNVMFIILTSVGVLFLIISVFILLYPPKKINGFYGYRTSRSMNSQDAWEFSQVYSSKIMVVLGLLYTFLGVTSLFIPKQEDTIGGVVSIVIIMSGVFYMFYKTEKKLAKKFEF